MGRDLLSKSIFFLIPTCHKYSEKTKSIRETWAKDLNKYGFRYLFLLGDPKLDQAKLEKDTLFVPCRDDYESLLLKLILGYDYLYHNLDFTYVYKIDDDCFPNLQKFQNDILPQLIDEEYFGGLVYPKGSKLNTKWHFGKCSNPKFDRPFPYEQLPFDYALGGYGYFLHKEILPILFQHKDRFRAELDKHIYSYEDVKIGEILHAGGIKVHPLERYSSVSASNYKGSCQYLIYDISDSELMVEIEEDIADQQLPRSHSVLNDYFDHIYVVNLKHNAIDRLRISFHLRQHGVNFEIFEATNGYEGEPLKRYRKYQTRELGHLKRYTDYSEQEIQRGHPFIASAGAMGYIFTYLRILKDAKKRGYKRFLVLEDDILLCVNFESVFKKFIENINNGWKILQLGVSQYGWENIDCKIAQEKGYYCPVYNDEDDYTYGSFAIAFDISIVNELIEAESSLESSFDHLPLGELYKKYQGNCFVAYPNIIMPDVTDSTIRDAKNQYVEAIQRKWPIENFDYPLSKPSIAIVIQSSNNFKYCSNLLRTNNLPFDMRLLLDAPGGLRPLYNAYSIDSIEDKIISSNHRIIIPESDYAANIQTEEVLTESDIVKFLEHKIGIQKENTTPLKEIEAKQRDIVNGSVSVILSVYRGNNHFNAILTSLVNQKYLNLEIIIIVDNSMKQETIKKIEECVLTARNENPDCIIMLLKHLYDSKLAIARNIGIMYAAGEYMCFLEDDIYLPGRLSESIKQLQTATKEVGAVYCDYLGKESKEFDSMCRKNGNLTPEILLIAFEKQYLHISAVTYRREIILSLNGFDESYRYYHDLDFHLRFFERYKMENIEEKLLQLDPDPDLPTTSNHSEYMYIVKERGRFLNQFFYTIKSIIHGKLALSAKYETKVAHSRKQSIWIKRQEKTIEKLRNEIAVEKNKIDLLDQALLEMMGTSFIQSPLRKIKSYKRLIEVWQKNYV